MEVYRRDWIDKNLCYFIPGKVRCIIGLFPPNSWLSILREPKSWWNVATYSFSYISHLLRNLLFIYRHAECHMVCSAFYNLLTIQILDAAFRLLHEFQSSASSKERLGVHTWQDCINLDRLIDLASEHFNDVVLPSLLPLRTLHWLSFEMRREIVFHKISGFQEFRNLQTFIWSPFAVHL